MISFIIPTYTGLGYLSCCFHSLLKHEPDTSRYEIITVFDAGPPKFLRAFKDITKDKPLKALIKEKREGFSSVINFGVRATRSDADFFVLVNDDIEFVRPVIDPLLAAFAEDPKIAVVGAKLWYPDGRIQHAGVQWTPAGPGHALHREEDVPLANHWRDCLVTGALFATRASIFREIGGFDESYKMGYEDTEYVMQALERGYRCVYRPTVMAIHAESATRGKDSMDPQNKGYQQFTNRWGKYYKLPEYPKGSNI